MSFFEQPAESAFQNAILILHPLFGAHAQTVIGRPPLLSTAGRKIDHLFQSWRRSPCNVDALATRQFEFGTRVPCHKPLLRGVPRDKERLSYPTSFLEVASTSVRRLSSLSTALKVQPVAISPWRRYSRPSSRMRSISGSVLPTLSATFTTVSPWIKCSSKTRRQSAGIVLKAPLHHCRSSSLSTSCSAVGPSISGTISSIFRSSSG